jgi:hypothetical protein
MGRLVTKISKTVLAGPIILGGTVAGPDVYGVENHLFNKNLADLNILIFFERS